MAYADKERTWSLSIYTHWQLYDSQIGRNYTLGYSVPFEWAAGKNFSIANDILKEFAVGAVDYAQWQISGNAINLTPTTQVGQSALNTLETTRAQIYAAGPGIQALTKYGLFALRFYEEFGAHATPSGQQLMFTYTLGGNPWGRKSHQ